jgi:hypothetical protein
MTFSFKLFVVGLKKVFGIAPKKSTLVEESSFDRMIRLLREANSDMSKSIEMIKDVNKDMDLITSKIHLIKQENDKN